MDLPSINFARDYLTERNNMVFDTSLTTRGMENEPYFLAIGQTLGNHITMIR